MSDFKKIVIDSIFETELELINENKNIQNKHKAWINFLADKIVNEKDPDMQRKIAEEMSKTRRDK